MHFYHCKLYKFLENGKIDQYQKNGPYPKRIATIPIANTFFDYPYNDVNAAYAEKSGKKYFYLLFYGEKYWKYEARCL